MSNTKDIISTKEKSARDKEFLSRYNIGVDSFHKMSVEHRKELLENAYLEMGDTFNIRYPDQSLFPYAYRYENEAIAKELISLFINPDYLHFTTKHLLNIRLFPYQLSVLRILWTKRLPMLVASRGAAKTTLIGIYCLLRAIIDQGVKIVISGAGLRQSSLVFQAMEGIWHSSPVIRDIIGGEGPKRGLLGYEWNVGKSNLIGIPLGGAGEKIRGIRANVIVADEFACLDKNTIVETDCGLMRIAHSFNEKDYGIFTGSNEVPLEFPFDFIQTPLTDVYEINTEHGFSFKCSNKHKVLTANGDFILAKDLKKDDVLMMPDSSAYSGLKINANQKYNINQYYAGIFGYLFGHFNGLFKDKHLHFTFNKNHFLSKEILPFFNRFDNVAYRNNGHLLAVNVSDDKKDAKGFYALLRLFDWQWDKVPDCILSSGHINIRAFLMGVFDVVNNDRLIFITSSKLIASDIQLLCKYCNILAELVHELDGRYSVNICLNEKEFKIPPKIVKVTSVIKLSYQDHLYDYTIPKTHQFLAGGFIQHNSINREIFETVLRGFASVQSQNTFEKVSYAYRLKLLEHLGLDESAIEEDNNFSAGENILGMTGNQIIVAGTASYQFNHFYDYYKQYCEVLNTKGKTEKGFVANWKEFAVVRIPHKNLPIGMMDEVIMEQGKALMSNIIFQMEYGAVFPKDSAGFYPASTLQAATCPITLGKNVILNFYPELDGDANITYVMGIDPASERDNLAISIVKIVDSIERHHVYTWSANRKRFEEDKKKNPKVYEDIHDYNTFIIRKIRNLFIKFNISRIHIDSGGGGLSIIEGLKDPSKLEEGEMLLFEMEDDSLPDKAMGLRCIKKCVFNKRDWYESAHFNLLKDFTLKQYLFPAYDIFAIEKARLNTLNEQEFGNLIEDTYENINMEIEQAKYQITLIEEQTTDKGSKRWSLPKLSGILTAEIKQRIRKDHFTSVLLANDAARDFLNKPAEVTSVGGYGSSTIIEVGSDSSLYKGKGVNKANINAAHFNNYNKYKPIRKTTEDGKNIFY